MTLHACMELQNQIRKTRIVTAGADRVAEAQELRSPFLIEAVQDPRERGKAQPFTFLLLQDSKGRRKPEPVRIFPKNQGAEGMDGTDAGIPAEKELQPEMARNLRRWGESQSLYEQNVSWQRSMMVQQRDDRFQAFIQAYAEASDATMAEMFPPRS